MQSFRYLDGDLGTMKVCDPSRVDEREPPVTECGAAVRALMRRYAAELQGRADLHVVVAGEDDEMFDLVPRNERAVPVTVEHSPSFDGGEVCIGFLGGVLMPVYSTPEWPGWITWMDEVISSVVAGRVVVLEGPGRRRIEIGMPDGETFGSTEAATPRGCLPLPGWRRRARVVRFEPY